jgi:hypothetical protein
MSLGHLVPRHTTTPGFVMPGRTVTIDEKPDGWHIVMIEDDKFTLLRVLPYGGKRLAYYHAQAFAEHYDAQCVGWSQ